MPSIKDAAAVVGVATTGFSTDSGRTEYSLAAECIKAALDDAGLRPEDVDGIVKDVVDGIDAMYIQKAVGIDNLTYASDSRYGTLPLLNAVTAVAAGIANTVVYYRSANNASGKRAGSDFRAAKETKDESLDMIRYDFHAPFGLLTPDGAIGMAVRRYLHEFEVSAEQVGWVPVVCSEHAAKNPQAIFHDAPITLADYIDSDVVVDPLRVLDCAPDVDGAIAIVVTRAERAVDLSQPPAFVMANAQGTSTEGEQLSSYSRPQMSGLPEMGLLGDELYRVAGIGPNDISVAQLDDRFAPLVPMQLEALGFCERGEGAAFCEGGDALRVGGRLALNTNGGFLGEGFSYGTNIIEAVRQIRGTSSNQVSDAEVVLVASGAGGPADGCILRR
ncbi:MAG: lipid-transfer protein [Acidimicrobiia bacterium]|nr:lipid-transfer protein [Acidimicrobiia bacterium]